MSRYKFTRPCKRNKLNSPVIANDYTWIVCIKVTLQKCKTWWCIIQAAQIPQYSETETLSISYYRLNWAQNCTKLQDKTKTDWLTEIKRHTNTKTRSCKLKILNLLLTVKRMGTSYLPNTARQGNCSDAVLLFRVNWTKKIHIVNAWTDLLKKHRSEDLKIDNNIDFFWGKQNDIDFTAEVELQMPISQWTKHAWTWVGIMYIIWANRIVSCGSFNFTNK